MKTLKKILLTVAGLVAWVMIGISSQMMEITSPRTTDDYVYAVLLILSVAYLHWALRTYLMPINKLPKAQAKELRDIVHARYKKGFNAGSVGAGYALLLLHVFTFFHRRFPDRPSFLPLALFLIAIGTFTQTRAVGMKLCEALKNKTESNQSLHSITGSAGSE
jgi:hypothetical protein